MEEGCPSNSHQLRLDALSEVAIKTSSRGLGLATALRCDLRNSDETDETCEKASLHKAAGDSFAHRPGPTPAQKAVRGDTTSLFVGRKVPAYLQQDWPQLSSSITVPLPFRCKLHC